MKTEKSVVTVSRFFLITQIILLSLTAVFSLLPLFCRFKQINGLGATIELVNHSLIILSNIFLIRFLNFDYSTNACFYLYGMTQRFLYIDKRLEEVQITDKEAEKAKTVIRNEVDLFCWIDTNYRKIEIINQIIILLVVGSIVTSQILAKRPVAYFMYIVISFCFIVQNGILVIFSKRDFLSIVKFSLGLFSFWTFCMNFVLFIYNLFNIISI